MAFKALQDTFLYNKMNSMSAITKNIEEVLNKGTIVKPEQAEEQLGFIRRSYKDPLKYKVLEAVNNGDIVMVYGPERSKVPTSIPFVLLKRGEGLQAAVFVDSYGIIDQDSGLLKMDTSKLYTMLEVALLSLHMHRKQDAVAIKSNMLSIGSRIFATIFVKVLSKKYALATDPVKYNKLIVLASKYYFLNILGKEDSEVLMNYAIKNCKNGNPLILQEVYAKFSAKDCEDIDKFIKALAGMQELNLKGLDTRNYLEGFMNMYDASTILSLENIYYFIFMIWAVTNSAYMNNQYALQTIIDKDGAKLYADLASIVR